MRGNCGCCGGEYNINADGTVRYHLTDKPECQATPGSRKCSGVGERPAGAKADVAGQLSFLCRVPSGPEGCGHQVQLTANYRTRSHLTPHGTKCAEGSSAPPIAVGPEGFREDTADWDEAKWKVMLGQPEPDPRDATAQPRTVETVDRRPAAAPEALRFGSDDAVEDFLGTGGPTPAERAAAAGDGRTAAQQTEIDRRMADPTGTTLEALLSSPEHITARSSAYIAEEIARIKTLPPADRAAPSDALFQANDPVECACNLRWRNAEAMRTAGHDDMDCDSAPLPHPAAPEPGAGELFDVVHRITDETGVEWIHPGEAVRCDLPECCTHPHGFEYGDDGKGHSGSFCHVCGIEEPEPCRHDYVGWDDWDEQNGTECITWACKYCGQPEPDDETAERAAERARCTVGQLAEGILFQRHTAQPPVSELVFRVQKVHPTAIESIVVSAGQYGGRHGMLTNLTEEITCTDLDGRPRPQRASASATPTERPTWRPQQNSSQSESAAPSPSPSKTDPAPGSRPTTPESAPPATSGTSSPATASGQTATAGTSTRTAPMTTDAQAAGDFLAAGSGSYGEAEAEYGRWGRYKLRHPATGKTVEWTRATTFAKSISDTYTLSQWAQRNVLVGATLRPDIVALAHGKDVAKDREDLNTWTEELQKAAGSKVAANLGTAVHSFTERVDRNWDNRWQVLREETPDEFKPHVEAYILLLEEHGLVPVPHMIEFSTGVLQYEVMGTSDNCYRCTKHLVLRMPRGEVRLSPGEHVIGDKKTGKDLDYGWQEICIQLALYAQGVNTQGIFNWTDKTWDPDPLSRFAEPGTKVREDVGVILHLPVDPRSTKLPGIHGVDLESGWNATVLCERVRTWRKLRTLAGPVAVVDADPLAADRSVLLPEAPAAPTPPARASRPPTIWERAEAVTSKPEASQVYQDAVAAKLPVDDVKKLIDIMSEKIAQVAEPGGAKV